MTGSTAEGRAFPENLNLTCNNWASSSFGSIMLGHIDRTPKTPANLESWNAAHMSRSCSQPDLVATSAMGFSIASRNKRFGEGPVDGDPLPSAVGPRPNRNERKRSR
jgi:hypothetical protein